MSVHVYSVDKLIEFGESPGGLSRFSLLWSCVVTACMCLRGLCQIMPGKIAVILNVYLAAYNGF